MEKLDFINKNEAKKIKIALDDNNQQKLSVICAFDNKNIKDSEYVNKILSEALNLYYKQVLEEKTKIFDR
ncbi:hypothetical protein CQA57_07995 [Helicobacter anseris]|uniref:Uncharacterized protein n=1 Tax=Helicobacter anseris TaxID=375926 RepID=A0A3D8J0L0_9HELI|nr:hypothetical protein [Helicobacter anseris]RDU71082.1 hypothetical protein CQA57_07995 [Helicobacter anseris]